MTIEVNPFSGGSGGGDVSGPGSSTTNGVARWANSSGTLLKNSTFTVSDAGEAVSPSLTASRVLVSGSGKEIRSSSVTTTTLGYLDATSSIQTQLDSKLPSSSVSAFGLTLIDDADAATARTTLELGTMATQAETAYALLAGRSGGQTLIGGTAASNNLTLSSTSNGTKGKILFGTSGYDEVNNRLGIGTNNPVGKLSVTNSSGTDQALITDMGGVAGSSSIQNIINCGGTLTGTNSFNSIGRGYQAFYLNGTVENATNANGIYSFFQMANLPNLTVTNMSAIQLYTGYGYNNSGTTVTNARGLWIKSWGNVAPATFTNQYGIYLENITGATNNYAIYSLGGASYLAGALSLGVTTASAKLHSLATTEQLRLGYDGSNYASFTVGSTGAITLQCTGSGRSIILSDSLNIATNTTTGSQIATAITQKLGFYGATPIVQRSGSAQVAVATTAATQTTPWGFSTQGQADSIVTLVNELRAWAVAQGFIKGAA